MAPSCHDTVAVLADLGLDPAQEQVYRALLRTPDADVPSLAAALERSEDDVGGLLHELAAAGLLRERPEAASGWLPVRPDVALEGLLAQEQAEVTRRQEQIVRVRGQLSDLLETYLAGTARRSAVEVELVEGLPAIRSRLNQLVLGAAHTVDSLSAEPEDSPEAVAAALEVDVPLGARGVGLRYLYPYAVRESVHVWPSLRAAEERGTQVRLVHEAPLRLVVVDTAAAVLPLDPLEPARGALFVHAASLVACAAALFELTWSGAEPVTAPGGQAGELHERDRALLALLASGAQDETVARQLGVAVRTVRRDLARLLDQLGASSRFHAGVLAARRGWV